MSANKIMAIVFWKSKGIIFIDYLEKGKRYHSGVLRNFTSIFKRSGKEKMASFGEKKIVSP